jgi:hypothetical protein
MKKPKFGVEDLEDILSDDKSKRHSKKDDMKKFYG